MKYAPKESVYSPFSIRFTSGSISPKKETWIFSNGSRVVLQRNMCTIFESQSWCTNSNSRSQEPLQLKWDKFFSWSLKHFVHNECHHARASPCAKSLKISASRTPPSVESFSLLILSLSGVHCGAQPVVSWLQGSNAQFLELWFNNLVSSNQKRSFSRRLPFDQKGFSKILCKITL